MTGSSPATIGERIFNFRNRILMDPRFQRHAPSLPFGGWMTRRRTRQLFDVCAGFVYSQVLAACVELDLFRKLEAGAVDIDRLAVSCGLGEAAMRRLCLAAQSLDLLESRPEGRFGLGQQGAALLGNPSVFAMIRHHSMLYADLVEPVEMLRRKRGDTRLGDYWAYAGANDDKASLSPARTESYSGLMADTQAFIAEEVIRAYPFSRHRQVLDVGGGLGVFVSALLKSHANISATVFDLPGVVGAAADRFVRDGVESRARVQGGDFYADPLPKGADLISLVRILHDHDDAQARALICAASDALPAGGRILIAEPMAGTRGARAMGDGYFGIYLWAMGSGRPRTKSELRDMLQAAGFRRVRECGTRQPLLVRVLVAEK
ncbi:MAG: methyltransferase [Alphaproteobacteria bacterium]|nr:methyltransferase [Alphaproteobacteria bacterium]